MRYRSFSVDGTAPRPPYRSLIDAQPPTSPLAVEAAQLNSALPTYIDPAILAADRLRELCDELDMLLVPTCVQIQSGVLDLCRKEALRKDIPLDLFVRSAIFAALREAQRERASEIYDI